MNQISYGASRLWIPITNPTIDGDWVNSAGIKGLAAGRRNPVISGGGFRRTERAAGLARNGRPTLP